LNWFYAIALKLIGMAGLFESCQFLVFNRFGTLHILCSFIVTSGKPENTPIFKESICLFSNFAGFSKNIFRELTSTPLSSRNCKIWAAIHPRSARPDPSATTFSTGRQPSWDPQRAPTRFDAFYFVIRLNSRCLAAWSFISYLRVSDSR